jgi:tetratricopeptide (TPR) repeat protein
MNAVAGVRTAVEELTGPEAYDAFAAADDEGGLTGDDLERYAAAAWCTGRSREFAELSQRAYASHLAEGDRTRAAVVALRLASHCGRVSGWQGRAERLLASEPEAAGHGHLGLAQSAAAGRDGRLGQALEHARSAHALAQRFADRELSARALHEEGRILLAQGDTAAGLRRAEEACAAAASGELDPLTTAALFDSTIAACRDLAELGRADVWIAAAEQWCERKGVRSFRGVCRVHRAGLMRARGELAEAERHARLAIAELVDSAPAPAGTAFHELGEIRLGEGDLDGAEEAFREAQQRGTDPQPGLALLRLARGDVVGAQGTIGRALAATSCNRLARARLQPAAEEIAAAALRARSDRLQPGDHRGGVLVGREDRIEDLDDPAPLGDQREALVEPHAAQLEGRQAERVGEAQPGVGDDWVEEAEALRGLELVLDRLCR